MTRRFEMKPTALPGLLVIQRMPLSDNRGHFERIYSVEELSDLGLSKVAQINRSHTDSRGTVRGMHYQHPPHAEAKLVSCLQGEVFDVAIDLRRSSPTFLCWHGERLSSDNHKSLFIPEGFAHGFQTLTRDCELLYLHTASYCPAAEDGIHPEDERVSIEWPLRIVDMSPKDAQRARLSEDFQGF